LKRNEIILVALMALINFTHILDFMIIMPLGNILMPLWNLTTSEFSIIVSSYSLAAFASSFFAIFFVDQFDRKKVLLFGYFGFLLGTIGCACAWGANSLIVFRTFTGLFGGIIGAQVLSIISDIVPYERRGQAMGMLMGGFAMASVVGVPLGLFLANTFQWYSPFIVVAGVGFVLYPFLVKFVPNVTSHINNLLPLEERIKNLKHIFSDKTQLIALSFSFLMIIGHFIIIPLFNPFLVYNVGVPQDSTPLVYFFGGLSSIITAQIIGKLADKYGKRQVFVVAATLSLFFSIIITNLPKLETFIVLIIFSCWFCTATGRTVPGQAMITQSVAAQTRGSFMSLNSCMQSLGTGLATLISGWVTYSDKKLMVHHYDYLGYISVFLLMISILLAYKLDKSLIKN
jgi:MFS transporter, DHA1 family, inner membrane transport protein